MDIVKEQIPIGNLVEGYVNNEEEGVFGLNGKLNIRPPYQREFVYPPDKRNLVIDTVIKGFPLNTMYWNVNGDGEYEVLDGQQRTISICEYVSNNFSYGEERPLIFSRQPDDVQNLFLEYELDIYKCTGEESERIEWFQVINVAGETLTDQEIRNAVYAGPWTAEAKRYFSKTECAAYQLGNPFMPKTKSAIRQDYLEAALKWLSDGSIDEYMNRHADDSDCDELWSYWCNMISWIKSTFIGDWDKDYQQEMKNVPWGVLYNEFRAKKLNPKRLQAKVAKLMQNEYVERKSGIYSYVLDGQEKHLHIRKFRDSDKRAAYRNQKGECNMCGKHFKLQEMEADHIDPWSKGGKTEPENCQVLCIKCNRRKGAK